MQKKILLAVILLTNLLFSSAAYAAIRRAAGALFSGRLPLSLQQQVFAPGSRGYSSDGTKDLQTRSDDCLASYKSYDDYILNYANINISPEELIYNNLQECLEESYIEKKIRKKLAKKKGVNIYKRISPEEIPYNNASEYLEEGFYANKQREDLAGEMFVDLYKYISADSLKYQTKQEYYLESPSTREKREALSKRLKINIFENIRFSYTNQDEWEEEYEKEGCNIINKVRRRKNALCDQLSKNNDDKYLLKKLFANVRVVPKRFGQFLDLFNRELSNDGLLPSIAQVISYQNNSVDGLGLLLSSQDDKYNNLIKPVLANEEKYKNDYLFGYHGCSDRIFLLHYLITKIHEKKYGVKIDEQLLVRPFELNSESYRDAVKRRMHLAKNGCENDTINGSDDQRHVISLNIGMMGSLDYTATSPLYYATFNENENLKGSELPVLVDPVLKQYQIAIDSEKREQLGKLFEALALNSEKNKGVLYQALINKKVADKFTYNSAGSGRFVDTLVDGEKVCTVKQLMDRLCANPDIDVQVRRKYYESDYEYRSPHAWHYRAILTQDALFKPNGQLAPGWKLFPHFLDEEHIKSYMNQIDQIVETIKFKS